MEPIGAHMGKEINRLTEKYPAHCLGGLGGPACMSSRLDGYCRQNTTVGSPPLVVGRISSDNKRALAGCYGSKDIAQSL